MPTTYLKRIRGFAIVAAIVILVILAGLAGFIVSLTTSQSLSLAQDVQSARAYQAARAGIEYGLSRWINNTDCAATSFSVDGFSVAITVDTTYVTDNPSFCGITATATTGGSPGSLGYIERQLRTVVEGNP